jgi:hypothetical protein
VVVAGQLYLGGHLHIAHVRQVIEEYQAAQQELCDRDDTDEDEEWEEV